MKQQCHVAMIYFTWIFYLGGLVFLGMESLWAYWIGWLIAVPVFEWLYVRKFPRMAPAMGYGNIADESPSAPVIAPVDVTLYTALGCPFCPLIEQRLEGLRGQAGFTLRKIDVTLRPDLLASKGIRSVPVVEIGGKLLVGLVSTKELAAALAEAGAATTAGTRAG